MKIEVCELLISSWLKYIKGCQVVQMNWNPSPLYEITEFDLSVITSFTEEVKEFMADTEIDIFKQSKVHQIIGQCEIDVVGLKVLDGNVDELYLVDSAFHEAGLSYNNNTATILKKLFRAIMVADIYFKNIPAQIVFVSPFSRESVSGPIQAQLERLQPIVTKYYPDMTISLLFNEDFAEGIYAPLCDHIGSLNNDNDLFLRSIKLMKLCDHFKSIAEEKMKINPIQISVDGTDKTRRGDNERKVFGVLNTLISDGAMTDEMIANLKSEAYSKRSFSMPTFPFLISAEDFAHKQYQRSRFYKNTICVKGIHYLVCSQWIPERIRCLDRWLNDVRSIKHSD